ncbi:3',5'-bisphosphate nucleotidase [Pleurostoma richardsiae]|uniref:3',5'-bisphosphate nucleotidase n=1 Tax=Pleurostoma richardsiae TaxID=41990 RepID=A0AA38VTD6_9PEZI|nr:3',5'-bisphosphate nucleotidase [Pleurostoma richardsiae]
MAPALYARERLAAELAVQRASLLTKRILASVNKGEFAKADSTPVTIADFAAQALLIGALRAAFPSDGFLGEESADALRADPELRERVWGLVASTRLDDAESEALLGRPSTVEDMLDAIDLGGRGAGGAEGRIWVMDPVDGTATFLRGEQYAVSLALIEDGRERVGILGCPNLSLESGRVVETVVDSHGCGLMLSAVRGQGAAIRPMGNGALQPARPIERLGDGSADLKDLHIVDCSQSSVWRREKVKEVATRLGATYPGTDVWSSHMRYAALIVGGGDAQLRISRPQGRKQNYIWDHAGAQLIFTEVGGKITDLDGKEIDFGAGRELAKNRGVIAARRGVHARILAVVNQVLEAGD